MKSILLSLLQKNVSKQRQTPDDVFSIGKENINNGRQVYSHQDSIYLNESKTLKRLFKDRHQKDTIRLL